MAHCFLKKLMWIKLCLVGHLCWVSSNNFPPRFSLFFTEDHRKTKVKLVNQEELTFFKSCQHFTTVSVLHLVIYLSQFFQSVLQVLGNILHDSDLGMTVKKGRTLRASTQIFMRVDMHIYQLRSKKYSSDVLLLHKKNTVFYTLPKM